MEPFLVSIEYYGELLAAHAWLPILIWTLAGTVLWLAIRRTERLHPQIHYHIRLALIYALPAGLLSVFAAEYGSKLLFSQSMEAHKLIYVTAPFDIGVVPEQSEQSAAGISPLYPVLFLIIFSGFLISSLKLGWQSVQLIRLRNSIRYFSADTLSDLDNCNRKLIRSIRKPVRFAFLPDNIVPVTFGFRKPVVLLPEKLKSEPTKLNLAIRHELSHISQQDFLNHALILTIQSLGPPAEKRNCRVP
jgi:beta-lactamase regulating signal transducer with metallopeptidase domain